MRTAALEEIAEADLERLTLHNPLLVALFQRRGGSYSEIAEIAVVSITASASDSGMRPPRISVLAA